MPTTKRALKGALQGFGMAVGLVGVITALYMVSQAFGIGVAMVAYLIVSMTALGAFIGAD